MHTRQVLVGEDTLGEIVFLGFRFVGGGACEGLAYFKDWLLNAGFGIFDNGFSLTLGDDLSRSFREI